MQIDSVNEPEDVAIGIATRDLNLYSPPVPTNLFWGYIPCSARKIGLNVDRARYGELCTCNDIIGVLLEFNKDQCKLSFYRNRVINFQ